MSKTVHVVRVPSLPDNQEVAIASKPDGAAIVYIHERHVTAAAAAALGKALTAAWTEYDRRMHYTAA